MQSTIKQDQESGIEYIKSRLSDSDFHVTPARVATKKGDDGYTSVFGDEGKLVRMHKTEALFGAIGSVDELNVKVGHLRAKIHKLSSKSNDQLLAQLHQLSKKHFSDFSEWSRVKLNVETYNMSDGESLIDAFLHSIQSRLFEIGSSLVEMKTISRTSKYPFSSTAILEIEQFMNLLESLMPPLRNFIFPAGNSFSIRAHEARVICRRAERDVLGAKSASREIIGDNWFVEPNVCTYINRLSDLFFTLARFSNLLSSTHAEDRWKYL